jgi:hypothetical protein
VKRSFVVKPGNQAFTCIRAYGITCDERLWETVLFDRDKALPNKLGWGWRDREPNQLSESISKKMRAYTYDNIEGDQRLPHLDPSLPQLYADQLSTYGLLYQHIPIDTDGNWEQVDI